MGPETWEGEAKVQVLGLRCGEVGSGRALRLTVAAVGEVWGTVSGRVGPVTGV